MTAHAPEADSDYTARAVSAITEALAAGDFPAWLADVLASVAQSAGAGDALTAQAMRAGWEAGKVLRRLAARPA